MANVKGCLIVHKVHGPGVIQEVLGEIEDPATVLVVKWVEDDGRIIIDTSGGRPPTVNAGEVRPVSAQEQVVMSALYKQGHRALAHAWLQEGRPHSYTEEECKIRKKIIKLMDRMQKHGATDKTADQLMSLRGSLLMIPDEKKSLQGRVEAVLQAAADNQKAITDGVIRAN